MSDALARVDEDYLIEIPGAAAGHTRDILGILSLMEEGNTIVDACLAAGISRRTYYRWRDRSEEFRRALGIAAARSKTKMISTWQRAAVDGHETTETRTREALVDGEMMVTEKETIHRTLPPDWRAAQGLVKARFPEEFGNINRIDVRHIGGNAQVDENGTPEMEDGDDPGKVIDTVLRGEVFVVPDD